jgi:hypothetical protein
MVKFSKKKEQQKIRKNFQKKWRAKKENKSKAIKFLRKSF